MESYKKNINKPIDAILRPIVEVDEISEKDLRIVHVYREQKHLNIGPSKHAPNMLCSCGLFLSACLALKIEVEKIERKLENQQNIEEETSEKSYINSIPT